MTATVALAGCGNIGRRHLQALAAMGNPIRVYAIEPDPAMRAALTAPDHVSLIVSPDALEVPESVDLAIVATGAQARRAALEALLARVAPQALLLEKVLFTSRRDLSEVGATLAARSLPAFVNCGRRGFAGYDALRRTLAGRRGMTMAVTGAGWGLCSNAAHFIDLAEHLLGEEVVALSGAALDPTVLDAKRAGCVEMTGRLEGRMAGGGALDIVCAPGPASPPSVEIAHQGDTWRIDEAAGRIVHRDRSGAEHATPLEARRVSEMPYLYAELLAGRSRLTPYRDSARQHALMLDAFRARLGLSIEEDAPCPIS
ncbi:MAG: hypothetical protein COW75_04715 [Rhodobacterales bacterium CG18_big_fil_WC_8_21_14_2_50_71_9]|nr:MAG: hypothetical protein COW75_04715 [Rhodobacterales bacterium CG18_big_fil_WC_8_21_14_2_50_71_9]PIY72680.1 MAG: hypothetical protein COY86_10830 [Rhodobacterales bacterium CG_4_10_14_0_8_um_filter_70_9]